MKFKKMFQKCSFENIFQKYMLQWNVPIDKKANLFDWAKLA